MSTANYSFWTEATMATISCPQGVQDIDQWWTLGVERRQARSAGAWLCFPASRHCSSCLCKAAHSTVRSPPRHKVRAGAAVHGTRSTMLQGALRTITTKAPHEWAVLQSSKQTAGQVLNLALSEFAELARLTSSGSEFCKSQFIL